MTLCLLTFDISKHNTDWDVADCVHWPRQFGTNLDQLQVQMQSAKTTWSGLSKHHLITSTATSIKEAPSAAEAERYYRCSRELVVTSPSRFLCKSIRKSLFGEQQWQVNVGRSTEHLTIGG